MSDVKILKPTEIEKKSLEIIQAEMGSVSLPSDTKDIIMRVIHTSADFDYMRTMCFSTGAVSQGRAAILSGATIVTDTNMAMAGINKKTANRYGAAVRCFMADEDVAREAKEREETRAAISMERAANIEGPIILAIGNAPTALIKLYDLVIKGRIKPELIIGVPVGFVNVVEAKELIMRLPDTEYIVARGRKGGSNVAAAIVNALMYGLGSRE